VLLMDRGKVVADGAAEEVMVPRVLEPVYQVKVREQEGGLAFERRS
jgi:ABC-type cobalamin transport system ATPase subunit